MDRYRHSMLENVHSRRIGPDPEKAVGKKRTHKRQFISLRLKIDILDQIHNGVRVSHLAKSLGLSEATIRTIHKNEDKIRGSVAAGCSMSAIMTSRSRAPILEKMEKDLITWIVDRTKLGMSLDSSIIKHKALSIYDYLKESGEPPINQEFVASKGWFDRFRKRFSLHNVNVQGDLENESIGEDEETEGSKYNKKTYVQRTEKAPSEFREVDINIPEVIIKTEPEDEESGAIPMGSVDDDFCSVEIIEEGLNMARQLALYFIKVDPCAERSSKFKRDLHKCLAPYKELHGELSKRQKMRKINEEGVKVV